MINTTLLTPQNLLTIGLISIVAVYLANVFANSLTPASQG